MQTTPTILRSLSYALIFLGFIGVIYGIGRIFEKYYPATRQGMITPVALQVNEADQRAYCINLLLDEGTITAENLEFNQASAAAKASTSATPAF